ncbi:MAG TPA: M28 family peptidase [Bacteroidales bacterium]|nr:M28 family peptidase [Bacteroidales bacterium]HRW84396.1 M28 family peptidase [Bacteroidales bacterium]
MKSNYFLILSLLLITFFTGSAISQKKDSGIQNITARDLESHMSFLASPLLRGRENGESGLEIAQQYIITQARLMGLKPASGNSFLQPYVIEKSIMHPEKTMISITGSNGETVTIRKPLYQILPTGPADFTVSGEVIFAGYGLRQDRYGYNDFAGIDAKGKILLVMWGAPTTDDGKKYLFEGVDWSSFMSVQAKLTPLLFTGAGAVMIVMDPKSGFTSIDQKYPGLSGQLNSSYNLKGEKPRTIQMPNLPKILLADRSVADELLKGSGRTLEQLQKEIDSSLKPASFTIQEKQVTITESLLKKEITLNNIAAVIDGSDPALKDEYVVFMAHADHIGAAGDKINAGADDNASGCSALLSIASAFNSLKKKPQRSLLFLWVSGEEIGLYGSQHYVNNPLVPLGKTVATLNMDMIGRLKGVADTTAENPMTGSHEVFVITGNQSAELLRIAQEEDESTILDFDYSLSGRDHTLQLFSRSDHYNFVKNDIPVLFFTTGLHTDYHTPGDVIEKIDFDKMELVTRTIWKIGFNVADRKERIIVDNPYSKW